MILERREREAALVTQCAHQIVEGVIARCRRTRHNSHAVIAMRSPVPSGSVLVMKHGLTSLNVGRSEVWSTVMFAGSVTLTSREAAHYAGRVHNRLAYISARMF
jgi:hypothetical protein